jgi:hypothetical protein
METLADAGVFNFGGGASEVENGWIANKLQTLDLERI